jgi:excisionase family DNA binding protein
VRNPTQISSSYAREHQLGLAHGVGMTRLPTPISSEKSAPNAVHDRCPAAIPAWALAATARATKPTSALTPIGDAQVLTITEAATMLRVCARTVRRMIDRGDLNAIRVGRSVRLRARVIANIIDSEHFPISGPIYSSREKASK